MADSAELEDLDAGIVQAAQEHQWALNSYHDDDEGVTFDQLAGFVAGVQVGVQRFADEMRDQGIHVGIGSPGRCVTCGGLWPCEAGNG